MNRLLLFYMTDNWKDTKRVIAVDCAPLLVSVGFVASASHVDSDADESEKYTFFWHEQSPFSQWYACKFTVDGTEYNCAEQYMMHQKACELLFPYY